MTSTAIAPSSRRMPRSRIRNRPDDCNGLDEIRSVYTKRFAENPRLSCTVHQRMEGPTHAIDKETVYGLPTGPLHIIAIYEVRDGLIGACGSSGGGTEEDCENPRFNELQSAKRCG